MNAVRSALAPGRRLLAYLTAGAPSGEAFLAAAEGAVRGGAALLEIGLPSPDPFADGPLLRRTHAEALRAGTNFPKTLELAARLRSRVAVPLVLLAYAGDLPDGKESPLEAAEAGFQGILVPDLPPEEASRLEPWARAGLHPAALLRPPAAPQPPSWASAFLYVARHGGKTGEGAAPSPDLLAHVDRLRAFSPLPRVAGFGVRRAEEAALLWGHAEGVAVGTALAEAMYEDRHRDPEAAAFHRIRRFFQPPIPEEEEVP